MEGGSGFNTMYGDDGDDGFAITDGSTGNYIDGGTETVVGDTVGYGMIGSSVTFNLTAGSPFTALRDSGVNTIPSKRSRSSMDRGTTTPSTLLAATPAAT